MVNVIMTAKRRPVIANPDAFVGAAHVLYGDIAEIGNANTAPDVYDAIVNAIANPHTPEEIAHLESMKKYIKKHAS